MSKAKDLKLLIQAGVSSKVNKSGKFGGNRIVKTYVCGIPFTFTFTIDQTTLEDDTITIMNMNSMKQIRISLQDVSTTIDKLKRETLLGLTCWPNIPTLNEMKMTESNTFNFKNRSF